MSLWGGLFDDVNLKNNGGIVILVRTSFGDICRWKIYSAVHSYSSILQWMIASFSAFWYPTCTSNSPVLIIKGVLYHRNKKLLWRLDLVSPFVCLFESCLYQAKIKGRLISECLFNVLNFPKKRRKNSTNFCPRT